MSFQSFPARMGSEGLGFWGMASSGGQRQTHYRLPLVSVSVCGGCWNTRMAPCLANVCLMHFEECVRTPIPRLKPSKCSVKAHRRPLLPFSTGKIKLNTFISNEKEVQITSKGGEIKPSACEKPPVQKILQILMGKIKF